MGDKVFAPAYDVLRERGVRFTSSTGSVTSGWMRRSFGPAGADVGDEDPVFRQFSGLDLVFEDSLHRPRGLIGMSTR